MLSLGFIGLLYLLYWLSKNYNFGFDSQFSTFIRISGILVITFLPMAHFSKLSSERKKIFSLFLLSNLSFIGIFLLNFSNGFDYIRFEISSVFLLILAVFALIFTSTFFNKKVFHRIMTLVAINGLIITLISSPFLIQEGNIMLLKSMELNIKQYLISVYITSFSIIYLFRYNVMSKLLRTLPSFTVTNYLLAILFAIAMLALIRNPTFTTFSHILPIFAILSTATVLNNYKSLLIDKNVEVQTSKTIISKKLISLFIILFLLRLLFIYWDKGYGDFHSGEAIFLDLIKSFSGGNLHSLVLKSQSIIILVFGFFNSFFRLTHIPTLLGTRFIINLVSFLNLILIFKIALLLFENHKHKYTIGIFSVILLGFNYFFIFFSNLIRPDAIMALIYNYFIYLLLKSRKVDFVLLSVVAGIALSFKGNGLLLLVLNIGAFILLNLNLNKGIISSIKSLITLKIMFSILILLMGTLTTYYYLTHYTHENILNSFFAINSGLERFGVGHYGLFPTNISFTEMYFERLKLLMWAFSPIIVLFPMGIIVAIKKMDLLKKLFDLNKQELLHIFVAIATLVFFIFIFRKPIQFARYYFPFISIFYIYTSYFIINTFKKITLYTFLPLYVIFNVTFYPHLLTNSRFSASNLISKYTDQEVLIPSNDKGWALPPAPNNITYTKITKIPEHSINQLLLVSGQNYYVYTQYLKNKEKYSDTDWFPGMPPSNELLEMYRYFLDTEPIQKIENNNLFIFKNQEIPYDIWFVTHPDYYIYQL